MIRKTSETRALAGNIVNEYNDSQTSAYSTEYINDMNTYSTSETFTGKYWVDGEPIYRMCFTGNVGNNTAVNFTINNISKLINCGGYVEFVDGSNVWQFLVNSTYGDNAQNAIRIVKPATANRVSMQLGTNLKNRNYEVFIEYTKSS